MHDLRNQHIKTLTSHLSHNDKLLFYGFLIWFIASFLLAITAQVKGVQHDTFMLVQGSADSQSYPTLDYSPFTAVSDGWQVGDELLKIDGEDMQGASTLSAYSALVTHGGDGELTLDLRREASDLSLAQHPPKSLLQVATLVTVFAAALCSIIALLGSTPSYITRCFYIAGMSMAVNGSYFYGLSTDLTYAWFINYAVSGTLLAAFGFKAVAAFPQGSHAVSLWQHLWPWLMAVVILVPGWSVVTNLPLRAEETTMARGLSLGFTGALIIGLHLRNFKRANKIGRSQLKWILLGGFLAFVPGIIASVLTAWSPAYAPLTKIIDFSNVAYPICWAIAILGYQALDADRVFSAVMTYTISAGLALLFIAGLLPGAADALIRSTALDPQTIYVVLSLLVCGALIPLHSYLRPRIESQFFPERMRLETAAAALSDKLSDCETEQALINTLSAGLADIQGAADWRTSNQAETTAVGYELKVEPSVGENVFIHLGKKTSGDTFGERDVRIMGDLVNQTETLLLKMRNQELTVQRKAAEQLAAEKSLFLASASHDLRQPMHALGLFSESLLNRNRDERLDPLVQQIRRSTRALDGMFNSILDLSKIDAGAMVPELGPVYLQLLFEELELEFSAAAQEKGLSLAFVPSSLVIHSDANLLARIMRNLVSNAIRYTDRGKILVGCRYGDSEVRIQVIDTGRGISAADQSRIFTAYARVDKHIEGGLGLGLSLVDKLCKLLDHPLQLTSTEGRGSLFSITAPVAAPSTLNPSCDIIVAPMQRRSLANLRVLAIDDDPAIRLGLEDLLSGWGCHVDTQDSLSTVLDWLASRPAAPELLLVDLHLTKRQDGLRILEKLFAQFGPIPALLITGDAQAGTYKWVAGVQVAILNKPLGPEKLNETMRDTLGRAYSSTVSTA